MFGTGRARQDSGIRGLVERNFTVTEPNRLWVNDLAEHPAEEGKVFCAAALDAFSRRTGRPRIHERSEWNLTD